MPARDPKSTKKSSLAYPRRSGYNKRYAPKTVSMGRTQALIDAALRIWELKNGYE